MRTLVIGDIHGAYKCLVDVLEKAGPADRVIFLGDYVDGLPDTFEVVEHIRNMSNAVCIRGNHCQWAIGWMDRCRELRDYKWRPEDIHYAQGGKSTYDSYMDLGEASVFHMNNHHQFLKSTLMHFVDEKNRLFVHGGIDTRGVNTPDMVKMWDRDLMQRAYEQSTYGAKAFSTPYSDFAEIYVGHTATKFFTGKEDPENWLNLWAMDTNCGWGGPLVAMDVDTKEMFYSKPAREHYPEYEGR